MGEPRWLNDREMRAWFGYRRMRLLLDLQINRELMNESGLSEPDYDVLSNLSRDRRASGCACLTSPPTCGGPRAGCPTTSPACSSADWSTARSAPTDGRGSMLVLTRPGAKAIRAAAPVHVASVRRHFIDLLTEERARYARRAQPARRRASERATTGCDRLTGWTG